MGQSITTSPDITFLDFAILYDLSVGVPSIVLTNQSVGNPSGSTNLDNCTWWYAITTPSGVYIHQGTESAPDVSAADWTTLTIPAGSWPTPFGTPPYGQVEFSCGVPYVATLYVKDSDDNIFSTSKSVTICRPPGNTDSTRGNFGVAGVQVTVKCDIASIYTNDTTNYTYQNTIGDFDSNTWTLAYPMDDSGNVPSPVVVTNQGRVIFGVGYSAEGYQLYLNTIASYDMGDDQTIKLQYKFKDVFNVYCNVNLCEIQCQIEALQKQLDTECGQVDNPAVKKKLDDVLRLQIQAITGVMQPLCGINVPAIIAKAKAIGGAKCDCSALGGINPIASTDGPITLNLDLTGLTGDVTNVGSNYTIALQVPGATAGTLQVVTDNGNITTNDMIVGSAVGAHVTMKPTNIQVFKTSTGVLAGIGAAAPSDNEGSLWVRSQGSNGTVYWRAAVAQTTYILVMPAAPAGAPGQSLINDGAGNLSWASAMGDLQTVTDAGNITTNDMISGDVLGNTALLSKLQTGLYNVGAQLIAFINNAGNPRLSATHVASGFKVNIDVPVLVSDKTLKWPSVRDGQMALNGSGTSVTVSAGAGAGTGPTINLVSGSNHISGGVQVLAGTTPTPSQPIVKINLGVQYLTLGTFWRGVIVAGNQSASSLTDNQCVHATSPNITVSGDELWINAGTNGLVGGTSYTWYYVNGF